MDLRVSCLGFLCWFLLSTLCESACRQEFAKYNIDRDMKISFYCSNHGRDWSYGVARFDEFCEKCYCFGYVMECCETGHVAGVVTMDGCIKASHGCKAVFYKFVNGVKINCLTGLPFDDRLGF
uniref:Uncharacterized protein LOC111127641 n=1 Tax=Crassostrea virginica TaxID=6565 RepID=A0A8B8DLF9_CRAVI|nr:uncharacterized protein LOC111127641 [Crassostrea virginica]